MNYNDLYQSLLTAETDGFDKAKGVYEPQLEEAKRREEEALQREEKALESLRSTILLLQEMGLTRSAIAEKIGKSETEIETILKG
jgi:DNA-directed RNA polymerase specialized sigma24 family protein